MANVTIKKGGIERVVDDRALERWKGQGWEKIDPKALKAAKDKASAKDEDQGTPEQKTTE